MTTHFKKVHRNGMTVTACRPFGNRGRSGGYMASTEVLADVDCVRCAKAMGVTPKAKQGPANPGGTCQVCFAVQRVLGGLTMTLHGYTRPGCGYIIGDCPGSKELPFEKNCDITRRHRQHLDAFLIGKVETLRSLKAGEFQSFDYTYDTNERNPDYMRDVRGSKRYIQATVTVKKGDKPTYAGRYTIPSFEALLEGRVFETEQRIRNVKKDMAFLDEKLTGWTVKDLLA